MVADGALLGSSFADYDMAAVRALPDTITFAGEDYLVLDVLQQLAVTLFMMFLDRADHGKLSCNLDKALFFRLFRHAGVHIRPLSILACSGVCEVGCGVADLTSVEVFVPKLRMLFLVGCSLLENLTDLYETVFLRLLCEIRVLVTCH